MDKKGMTMGELLIVVGIISILAALTFIGVASYQRSFAQMEKDRIAKEIYYAAQNHMTSAVGAEYFENTDFGTAEENGIYYVAVHEGDIVNGGSILDDMLPFGSIDETVRGGGNYVIRYQKESGKILDVFYCGNTDERFGFNLKHLVAESGLSALIPTYQGEDKRGARKRFRDNAVLGWYGADGSVNDSATLLKPFIKVTNAERLYVSVNDRNTEVHTLKLIVTGETSGAQKGMVLLNTEHSTELIDASGRILVEEIGITDRKTVVLDDITNNALSSNRHFSTVSATTGNFIPGENLRIKAVAYKNTGFANIANSTEVVENSLFAGIEDKDSDKIPDTAYISNSG